VIFLYELLKNALNPARIIVQFQKFFKVIIGSPNFFFSPPRVITISTIFSHQSIHFTYDQFLFGF